MFSKKHRVLLRRLHRWGGVIIGIQLFLWIVSGAYFAWIPFKLIKGEDRKVEASPLELILSNFVTPADLRIPDGFKIKSVNLESTPAGSLYRVESIEGKRVIFDATSGVLVPLLDASLVVAIALNQTSTASSSPEVSLLSVAKDDYKGTVPVYKVELGDFRNTRLYLDPWSGKVVASRNRFWRIYDFLWMLHIMDFQEREDLNNILLKFLSLGAFVLIASGYLLFFLGKPPKRNRNPKRSELDLGSGQL